jgi:hypothetical protein
MATTNITGNTGLKKRYILIAVIVIVFIAGWMVYDYGKYKAGFDRLEVEKERVGWENRFRDLEKQLDHFRNKIARLESAKKVDMHASTAIRDALNKMQQENQELREELQFYRAIVSPGKGRPGVHIHNFKLDQASQKGRYHFNLTLIHLQGLKKHHREASGRFFFNIEGKQKGQNVRLVHSQVSPVKKDGIRFRFRYFARFEGNLQLPAGFKPSKVEVEVKSLRSRATEAKKEMPWPLAVR